jgi:hypothetical protein
LAHTSFLKAPAQPETEIMPTHAPGLKPRAVAALALLAVALAPTLAHAQTPKEPTHVERAQKMLASEVTMITKLMHPTATYQSYDMTVVPRSEDRFQIVAKYHFKNFFGQPFFSTLHFNFTAKGRLEEIQPGERDGYVAPFVAADVGANVIEMVRNNKEVTLLLRRGQVRAGLILWLNGGF